MSTLSRAGVLVAAGLLATAAARGDPVLQEPIPPGAPPAVQEAMARLRSPDAEQRVLAAYALGRLGEDAACAIPFLVGLLGDATIARFADNESASPGDAAVRALVAIGKPSVAPLLETLGRTHWLGRPRAVRALGRLGHPRAIEPLIDLLLDSDKAVRTEAIAALACIGLPAVRPLALRFREKDHRADDLKRRTAVAVLRAIGEPAAMPLATLMETESPPIPIFAGGALAEMGDAGTGGLVAALASDEIEARRWAAYFLGLARSAKAVDPLVAALHDPQSVVRCLAAHALGKIGDGRAVGPLLAALDDEHWTVRAGAATSLGLLGDRRGVEPLIARLGDDEYRVRRDAATALGQLADPRAVDPLIAALRDRRETARLTVEGRNQGEVRREAAKALGLIGDRRALDPLIEALGDLLRWEVRRAAAEALGRLGDRRATAALAKSLADPHEGVRRAAASALGRLGDAAAVEPLIAGLQDADASVRREAATALGQLGDARAVKALVAALSDRDRNVGVSAAAALRAITGEALGDDAAAWLRWWHHRQGNLPGEATPGRSG